MTSPTWTFPETRAGEGVSSSASRKPQTLHADSSAVGSNCIPMEPGSNVTTVKFDSVVLDEAELFEFSRLSD